MNRFLVAVLLLVVLPNVTLAQAPPAQLPPHDLAAATKKVGPSVFMIGAARGGHGTGFLISTEHRLIATNAHVADIMHASGKLFAIRNDTATAYKVEKIFYHPEVMRYKVGKPPVVSMNPADGEVHGFSPDVAILQLAVGGPELPAELSLADDKTLDDLLARQIGILGFPGHDSHWPEAGEVVSGTFHDGAVSRVMGFNLKPAEGPAGRKLVQCTIQTLVGDWVPASKYDY